VIEIGIGSLLTTGEIPWSETAAADGLLVALGGVQLIYKEKADHSHMVCVAG
jgi:hypothetical protein